MTLLFLGLIVLLVWAARLQNRVNELEAEASRRAGQLAALDARLRELTGRPKPEALRPEAAQLEESQGEVRATAPKPTEQAAALKPAQQPPPVPTPRPVPPRPVPPPPPRPIPHVGSPSPQPGPLAQTAASRLRTDQPSRPAQEPAASRGFDLEALVGVKLFSWVAGVALALGAVFFLRHSIQSGWLQPPVRMAMGVIAGIGLLVACEMKAARRYAVTSNALDAAGIAILFSTFFAAHTLWGLTGPVTAFALLVLVTATAVLLAIRHDSVFIALLGLVGGFATPALLSSGEDNPFGLFGYLLLLNGGLAWVAYRKRWVVLVALSLLFTTFYQWSWVLTFLTPSRMPLALGIFVVFPLLAWGAVAIGRSGAAGPDEERLRALAAVNASLPLLLTLYVAVVPAYGSRFQLLFGFLFLLDAGLYAIARARGPKSLHALGAASTLLVFYAWCVTQYPGLREDAWRAVLAFVALFVGFYLVTARTLEAPGKPEDPWASRAVLAAPLLLFMFPALAAAEPGFAAPWLPFSTLLLLAAAVAARAVAKGDRLLHLISAFMIVATEAVWSAKYLAADRVVVALAVYTVFGLFFLGVPVIARRLGKPPAMMAGASLAWSAYAFLLLVAVRPSLSVPPWPLFAALLVLVLGAGGTALYLRQGVVHLGATVSTQVILIVWAGVAGASPWPTTAGLGMGVTAALALACSALARRSLQAGLTYFDAASASTLLLGQAGLIVVSVAGGAPSVGVLAGFHLAFLAALLALASWSGWFALAIAGVVPTSQAALIWQVTHRPDAWMGALTLATPIYLAFLAYPLVLGRRLGRQIEPHLAATLASGAFFLVARRSLIDGGWSGVLGVLPLVQGALTGLLLIALLRLERPGGRTLGRLALVAGTALAFLTLAIPLQLEKEWLTLGWALEGAALAWLYTRIPHRGLLWATLGLLAVVFVRLAVNPEVFVYHARGTARIWNWYLYTYVTAAASMLVAAWQLRRTDDSLGLLPRGHQFLGAAAVALLFLLLNIEIADFYATGSEFAFHFSAGLAQDLTYTLGWAAFAVSLLAAGIVLRSHAARLAAITLLTVTVLKGFLHDVARLGGLYRVVSFVGLAICLSLVAVVLQRFVLSSKAESRDGA